MNIIGDVFGNSLSSDTLYSELLLFIEVGVY